MRREDDRQFLLNLVERRDEPEKHAGIVDVGRPVQGQYGVAAAVDPQSSAELACVRGEVIEERVYHHVADAEDALVGDTFRPRFSSRLRRA